MSFHFCAHAWEVRNMQNGTLVTLMPRDLGAAMVPVLVDELLDLALEYGQCNLYLDLAEIRRLDSDVLAKMVTLDSKLREHGGRLILINLDAQLYEICQTACLTEVLDIRPADAADTVLM